MSKETQSEALRAASALRGIDARSAFANAALDKAASQIETMHARIAELEAQIEAVGAAMPSDIVIDALARIYEIATSAVHTRSRDMGDWYDDMERIATIAAQHGNHLKPEGAQP